ncbi:MAG: RNA methyltransferase [Planctomycetota bacterium]
MDDRFDPIPTTVRVTSPDDPRIAEYRALRENRLIRPTDDAPHGLFIAEGEKVVRLLLAGNESGCLYEPRSVLVAENRVAIDAAWLRESPVPVYAASRAVMDAVVGFPIHRGVLASAFRRPDPPLNDLLAAAGTLLVCEGLANHDNLGGLFRAAAALADRPALLLDSTSCDPLYRKCIRVSMGHALRVPAARLNPFDLCLVREAGFTAVALTTDASAAAIGNVAVPAKSALLLGAEGPGLSAEAMRSADVRVRIPIRPGVDSLNVVTAAAIALHRIGNPTGL